jgi:alpha-D-ribose 1-methylphosphonate 5-triphosphate synthase subunit PhnI
MGYVAVTGGQEAIENAEILLNYYRMKNGSDPLEVEQIRDQMRLAVDRVMGEGALYAPTLAALALKQAEGDPLEASLIVRAYRATQSRRYYALMVDTGEMQIIRRISATFQEVPGGQILGPTRDYTQRLLDFSLLREKNEEMLSIIQQIENAFPETDMPDRFPKVIDLLRQENLLAQPEKSKSGLKDITRESLAFPCERSAKLQTLARAETGSMMALAYSISRGWGEIHPFIGELRVGYVPLYINHKASHEPIYVGKVLLTEAEIISGYNSGDGKSQPKFALGYGACFGHNEIKAISMGILDVSTRSQSDRKTPAEDEEFVLYHTDGVEASGFVAHWKLPHYVTFQSTLDRLRATQNNWEENKDE